MQLLSNELKAVAVMADISENGATVTRDQCMTVEHFDYRCARKRDRDGRTYASSEPVELAFSVRINGEDQAKPFYRQLCSGDEYGVLSFLFNTTFQATGRLDSYEQALAVEGFVVDVQEDFHSAQTETNEGQIILRARMLVRSIIYVGQNNNKILCFIH
ncbi:MAG: hypothetical protein J5884_00730 [Paludibacteraceae bacterium]|nr:hypothetical protein [Paludibacteraceae bacterium]